MKGKKIFIISIVINIITIGFIYNFIKKDYLNNEKIIVKAMTEGEYEDYITSLNQSHIDYANYIQESKTKIASAITDMGVSTSNDDTPETMSNNIKSIAREASSIIYDNSSSTLTSTNVQGAVDEINDSLENVFSANDFNITGANYIGEVSNNGNITIDNFKTILVIPCYGTTVMRSPSIVHLNLFDLTGILMLDIGVQNGNCKNPSLGFRITKDGTKYTFSSVDNTSNDVTTIKLYGIA